MGQYCALKRFRTRRHSQLRCTGREACRVDPNSDHRGNGRRLRRPHAKSALSPLARGEHYPKLGLYDGPAAACVQPSRRWFAFSGLSLVPSLLIVLPASLLLGPGWSDIAWLFLAGVLPLVPAAIFFAIGVFLSILNVTNDRRGVLIILIVATLGAIVFSDHLLFVFLLYGILAAIWLLLQKRRVGLER